MSRIGIKMLEIGRAGKKMAQTCYCTLRSPLFVSLYMAKHQNLESAPVDRVASTWC